MSECECREIVSRIEEIAIEQCPEYPEISTCSTFEKLWAIHETLKGLRAACDEWWEFVKFRGVPTVEQIETWKKFKEQQNEEKAVQST